MRIFCVLRVALLLNYSLTFFTSSLESLKLSYFTYFFTFCDNFFFFSLFFFLIHKNDFFHDKLLLSLKFNSTFHNTKASRIYFSWANAIFLNSILISFYYYYLKKKRKFTREKDEMFSSPQHFPYWYSRPGKTFSLRNIVGVKKIIVVIRLTT